MAKFYTVQLSKVRKMKNFEGKVYNITVKNGMIEFAPTWDIVMGIKNNSITEEEYTKRYCDLMRKSYNKYSDTWQELINSDLFAISCFCNENDFCHRFLLAKILEKCGCEYLGEWRE